MTHDDQKLTADQLAGLVSYVDLPRKLAGLAGLPDRLRVGRPATGLGDVCRSCGRPMPDTPFQLWLDQHGESLRSLGPKLREMTGLECGKNRLYRIAHHWPGWRTHNQRSGRQKPASRILEALIELTGLPREAFQQPIPGNGGYYFEPGSTAGSLNREPADG